MSEKTASWDAQTYRGWTNRHPFTDVVSFVLGKFGSATDRGALRVLDLGCGGGHHLLFLAREGFDYYGVDGSRRGLEIAGERLEHAGFEAKNLHLATFEQLPFEDDFFDCVIDRGAVVCNRKAAIPGILGEIRRTMKPGAALYSTIIHEDSAERRTARALGDNDYTDFAGHVSGAGVLHFTNAQEASELFGAFQIDRIVRTSIETEYPADSGDLSVWTTIYCRK